MTDVKDRKILYALEYAARKPLSSIAKQVGLPKQVVTYRINKLKETEVIRNFLTVVDSHRLGYFSYRLYLRFQNLDPKHEQILFEKIKKRPNLLWFVLTTGRWDAELVFLAKNNIHFSTILRALKNVLGNSLKEYELSSSVVNYHFRRKYLHPEPDEEKIIPRYGFEPPLESIDAIDFEILKKLSQNADRSYTALGNTCNLSYNGIKKRIRSLEKRGIIQAYRSWISIEKLGRLHYKALITLSLEPFPEKKLLSFCLSESSVTYLIQCTGRWELEIEAEVESEEEFRQLLIRFRNTFSDLIKDYEILHIHKELFLDYFPFESLKDF